jgi:hypothetical protein
VILCYALGGGLGHLTRVRAYLHTRRPGEPATIISASPLAADPRVVGAYRVLRPPAGADLCGWIAATLRGLAPDEFVVDAFPAGLHGELSSAVVPPAMPVTHLARLLRWAAYAPLTPRNPLRFDQTWCVEPLAADHRDHLAAVSSHVAPLRLSDPAPGAGDLAGDLADAASGAWLVVHTGPDDEVLDLLDYARETAALEGLTPRLVLVSPRRPAATPTAVRHLDVYPAWPLFGRADRIITAAGCNVVRQAAPWRARHRMVPFARRFDDQFTRAARIRAAASGPNP